MFYTEEDVQPVIDVVIEKLGVVGNMAHGRGVLPNITVSTPEFGKVWYGDYVGTTDQLMLVITDLTTKTGYKFSYEMN